MTTTITTTTYRHIEKTDFVASAVGKIQGWINNCVNGCSLLQMFVKVAYQY